MKSFRSPVIPILIFALSLLSLTAIASPLHDPGQNVAATDGITGAQEGLWYDPSMPGSGLDIRATPGGVFIVVYVSRNSVYGWPTWFTAQADDGASAFDLLATDAHFGDPRPQFLLLTGTLTARVNDDGSISAVVAIEDDLGPSPPAPSQTVAMRLVRLL